MKYIGVKEAAAKWGLSDRRVRWLCTEGKIEGACKLEWSWTRPEDTHKPSDGRVMRRARTLGVRLGNIDSRRLDKLKEEHPFTPSLFEEDFFKDVLVSSLETSLALEGRKYLHNQVVKVLSGLIAPSLSLRDHLLYINYKTSLIRSCSDQDAFNNRRFASLYGSLTHGIDESRTSCFREGGAAVAKSENDNFECAFLMEMLSRQFESDYKFLHPVFKAVILYAEVMRVKPFRLYNEEMAMLLLDSMLLSNGYPMPLFDSSIINELNAATSLAFKLNNYQSLAQLVERCLMDFYKELSNV